MKALFPPILDPNTLPRRVLVVAPHSDDEIFGCGGMLAFHAERGDDVRVLVLTDGYIQYPATTPSYDVLWALIGNYRDSFDAPYGSVVRISTDSQ